MLRGRVVRVDRFGNLVTNLDRRSCERVTEGGADVQLTVGDQVDRAYRRRPTRMAPGEVGALFGSTEHLECAMRSSAERGRAARRSASAMPVELRPVP